MEKRQYLTQSNLETLKEQVRQGLQAQYSLSAFESYCFSQLFEKSVEELFEILNLFTPLSPLAFTSLKERGCPEDLILRLFDYVTGNEGLFFELLTDKEGADVPQGFEYSRSDFVGKNTLIYVVENALNNTGYLEYNSVPELLKRWRY